jgi:NAD(P)-dependent dehydrogenase (short-subunit alcohol dehydrogenase family)
VGRFDGQVAWVTGGGSGIGRALALELGKQGATVAVSGRRRDRLDEVVAALEAAGGRGRAVPCDVTDDASVEAAVADIVEALGGLDVVVANAGFGVAGRIAKLTTADWQRQLDTNVLGVVRTVSAALPHVLARKGRIALMGSVAAFAAPKRNAAYSASKAAVHAYGLTLQAELAGTGASATLIHPGFIASEIGQVDNDGVYHPDRQDPRPAALMWQADAAARVMVRGIAARKPEVVVTGHGKAIYTLARLLPGVVRMIRPRT